MSIGDGPCAKCWHMAPEFPGDKKGGQVDYPQKGFQNAVQECLFQVAIALHSKFMAQI